MNALYSNISPAHRTKLRFPEKILLILLAIMLGVLSTSAMYEDATPPAYRLPIFGTIIGLILLFSGLRIGNFSRQKILMLFLWFGYSTFSLIGGLVNQEDILPELWQLGGVPLVIFSIIPYKANKHANIMVLWGVVLAFSPYIIMSLFLYPISSPYQGVFPNPNSMGIMVATLSAALLALLRGVLVSKERGVAQKCRKGLLVCGLITIFIVLVVSNSRTSLISFFCLYLIFVWSLFIDKTRIKAWIILTMTILVLSTLAFFVMLPLDGAEQGLFDGVVRKFTTKADSGDISSGRLDIWRLVIDDVAITGHGNYGNILDRYGVAVHNTYMTVLAAKGPIAFAFYVPVHLFAFLLAYRFVIKTIKNDGYALGPLMLVINYIILGFTELVFGTLGNGINMAFLLMVGFLINYDWDRDASSGKVN